MKRTLAVALLLADLRPAGGFQPHPTIVFGGHQDRKSSRTADDAITGCPITGTAGTALRYANDPHSASDAASAASTSTLPDTTDPFVLLGLDAAMMSSHDQSTLKAAYRRMTRRHHPDAVLSSTSTAEERRQANDDFARINEAYQTLLTRQQRTADYWGGGGEEEFGAQTFVDLEVRSRDISLVLACCEFPGISLELHRSSAHACLWPVCVNGLG